MIYRLLRIMCLEKNFNQIETSLTIDKWYYFKIKFLEAKFKKFKNVHEKPTKTSITICQVLGKMKWGQNLMRKTEREIWYQNQTIDKDPNRFPHFHQKFRVFSKSFILTRTAFKNKFKKSRTRFMRDSLKLENKWAP